MKIKIYSIPSCPFCKQVKDFLQKNSIEFEDINIDENERARDEMIKKSGQTGVPVIEIKKSHSVEMIVGFDEEKLKQALGL